MNLLRMSHSTPKISAFAHVHGPHNFMLKPMVPLGCLVQAHEKPGNRGTWAEHSIDAWNLGTSLEHHRAFIVYSKQTRATQIADTLYFKHKYLTTPAVTPEDAVVAAAQQLTNALKGNTSSDSEHFENLKTVAKVFEDIAKEKQLN